MIRFFARWWARRQYIWREEATAALNDLNAAVSQQRAEDKRALIAQVNKEAEAIEKHIAAMAEMEEKGFWRCESGHEIAKEPPKKIHPKKSDGVDVEGPTCDCGSLAKFLKRSLMTGQEKYESDQERKGAEQVAKSKREYAARLPEEVKGQEDTAKHFRRQGASSRELAERLRRL